MIQEQIHSLRLPYPGREERLVRVFVPAHEEGERLPVIYMTDGQNLFDEESSGFGCWHTREAVRAQRAESGRAAIVVGIHNDDPRRECDLTPAAMGALAIPEEERQPGMSQDGEVFADFVVHTAMPAVEARFPVLTGRAHTAVCGSSCGGVMALFLGLRYPERFCAAGVLSPALLLFREEDLQRWIWSRLGEELPYLYLYTGAGDELEARIFESTERAYDMLQECYPMELLNEVVLLDQPHHERAWEPIFRDFLHLFLYRQG